MAGQVSIVSGSVVAGSTLMCLKNDTSGLDSVLFLEEFESRCEWAADDLAGYSRRLDMQSNPVDHMQPCWESLTSNHMTLCRVAA